MGGAIPGLHASPGPGGVPPTSGSGPPLCAAGPGPFRRWRVSGRIGL